jgi:prepilin-type N-terminal cleavage/methylation domain-containing protein
MNLRGASCSIPHLRRRTRRAVTLVELMISLVILAIISTAIFVMLRAGAQVSGSITGSMTSEWEVETAIARILPQVRHCTSINVPYGTTGGPDFSLVTQPDSANGNTTYNVQYKFTNGQLQEIDSRYGTSVLIRNVQSFSARTKNSGSPTVLILTMTVGAKPPVTRTVRITPRNQ